MDEKRFLSMLGLCRRAGQMIIGTDLVTKSLPSGKVLVSFYTADSSDNTKKKIQDKCSFYRIKCIQLSIDSLSLSSAIGKDGKICVVGITNDSFSEQLIRLAENQ